MKFALSTSARGRTSRRRPAAERRAISAESYWWTCVAPMIRRRGGISRPHRRGFEWRNGKHSQSAGGALFNTAHCVLSPRVPPKKGRPRVTVALAAFRTHRRCVRHGDQVVRRQKVFAVDCAISNRFACNIECILAIVKMRDVASRAPFASASHRRHSASFHSTLNLAPCERGSFLPAQHGRPDCCAMTIERRRCIRGALRFDKMRLKLR
jgi:hypothetical protein